MNIQNTMLEGPKEMVLKALDKTKEAIAKVNGYALNKTEDIVSEGIVVAEQWQVVGKKALQGSLKLAAKQQDVIFEALSVVKKHISLSKKRMDKLSA